MLPRLIYRARPSQSRATDAKKRAGKIWTRRNGRAFKRGLQAIARSATPRKHRERPARRALAGAAGRACPARLLASSLRIVSPRRLRPTTRRWTTIRTWRMGCLRVQRLHSSPDCSGSGGLWRSACWGSRASTCACTRCCTRLSGRPCTPCRPGDLVIYMLRPQRRPLSSQSAPGRATSLRPRLSSKRSNATRLRSTA